MPIRHDAPIDAPRPVKEPQSLTVWVIEVDYSRET